MRCLFQMLCFRRLENTMRMVFGVSGKPVSIQLPTYVVFAPLLLLPLVALLRQVVHAAAVRGGIVQHAFCGQPIAPRSAGFLFEKMGICVEGVEDAWGTAVRPRNVEHAPYGFRI